MIRYFLKLTPQQKWLSNWGGKVGVGVFPSLVTFLKLCHLLFWFSQALWLFWSCVIWFFGFPKPCDFFEVVSPAFLVFPSIYLFEAEPLCLHASIFPSFALISMCGFILPYIIPSGNLFGSGLLERPVNKHIMGITTGNLCDGSVFNSISENHEVACKRQTHSFSAFIKPPVVCNPSVQVASTYMSCTGCLCGPSFA